jgi:hypothetical protein
VLMRARAVAQRFVLPDTSAMKSKAKKLRPYYLLRWGGTELSMLGRWPDAEIARITSRPLAQVVAKRKSLGIPAQNLSA